LKILVTASIGVEVNQEQIQELRISLWKKLEGYCCSGLRVSGTGGTWGYTPPGSTHHCSIYKIHVQMITRNGREVV
jgi:hypothetical protein